MPQFKFLNRGFPVKVIAIAALIVTSALTPPPVAKFVTIIDGKLVVRLPQKAYVGKVFNIGIYTADSLVETKSGGWSYRNSETLKHKTSL